MVGRQSEHRWNGQPVRFRTSPDPRPSCRTSVFVSIGNRHFQSLRQHSRTVSAGGQSVQPPARYVEIEFTQRGLVCNSGHFAEANGATAGPAHLQYRRRATAFLQLNGNSTLEEPRSVMTLLPPLYQPDRAAIVYIVLRRRRNQVPLMLFPIEGTRSSAIAV